MILIVNPHGMKQGPYFDVPTNLLYLVAALREEGVPCALSDGNLIGLEGVKKDIDTLRPDIVGISCLSPVRFNALEIANYAKGIGTPLVIMGGHHTHWMWEQVLNTYPYVDAVVFGEGERALVDIAKHGVDVPGVAHRLGGSAAKTQRREYVQNLDDLPFPAWDMVDIPAYRATRRAIGPRVIYSRGCKGRCKFCNSTRFWRGYRHRSPENFCEELAYLHSLGEDSFAFGDDNIDSDGIVALFEVMASKQNIARPSSVTMRVDGITEESCTMMSRCGVQAVCLGIESASQPLLDHMQKDITVGEAENAVGLVKKHGMKAVALLIRNSIGETAADKQATVSFCNRVKPDDIGSVDALWLYPGTAYYKEIQEGKHDHLIKYGKELVNDSFFTDPRYAQHVISWVDGQIKPMRVTDG